MAAASPPLNTANSVDSYSTDGNSYTTLNNVLNFKPSGRVRKIIERRRKGVAYVEKFATRRNQGNLEITLEYGSALWAVFDGFFDNKTKFYFKEVMDDTGGTNGSTFVYFGPISDLSGPETSGDDSDETFTITMAVETLTFTPGA